MNDGNTTPISDMIGKTVIDDIGYEHGTISDVLIDYHSNKIMCFVLKVGGALGARLGGKLIPIPFQAVQFNPNTKQAQLKMAKEKIEKAPAIKQEDLGKDNFDLLSSYFTYFGLHPGNEFEYRDDSYTDSSMNNHDKSEGSSNAQYNQNDGDDDMSDQMDYDKLTGKE